MCNFLNSELHFLLLSCDSPTKIEQVLVRNSDIVCKIFLNKIHIILYNIIINETKYHTDYKRATISN